MDQPSSGIWVTRDEGGARLSLSVCRVAVESGPDAGRVATFEKDTIRVGGRAENDLVLTDPRVSGIHLELRLDERGFRVRDLDSTNGTRVGGVRIRDAYVEPGQLIAIGRTVLSVAPTEASVAVPLDDGREFPEIIGESVAMQRVYATLRAVAPTDATVLLTGETGTGKEVVAEAIHQASPRAGKPFVVVDCGAIPATLFENELFGHVRGAFTGADRDAPGAFERAHGGTLFLDEVGELPLDLQPKLLRALQSRTVQRVGGSKPVACDVRIIAATNRDLLREVNRGAFRADLYYRLAVACIVLPALRDRPEDVPLLAQHFCAELTGDPHRRLPPELLADLAHHTWPGNVRELRNAVERAVLLPHLPPRLDAGAIGNGNGFWVPVDPSLAFKDAKQQLIDEFDRRYVEALLGAHGGNVAAAARAAGLDRASLHKIISRLGLRRS